ncbi:LrgB family protein [Flammeovirga kamogawensis]|uniref:LrgB family protein n=1 Tax=Flammeovirga kamogawensis TaxID=373891 RepID=A0ABX8GX25_9BACT|nr:LrgB family protein [Flammeovirga kamogawensis]MBB6460802.1 putative murein hydrolase (TIGR00659 family) [Flammeovirga kamogawensis]QWG08154.1 LrgB family protein [Flammeovirga kamogawensis]TRX69957.1 LrgB family protein [Flammeovirga kamogawensis]
MKELLHHLFESETFVLAATLGLFLIFEAIYQKVKSPILNPVLLTILTLIVILKSTNVSYQTYKTNAHMIHFMLGPSVVALGYLLYEQLHTIGKNAFTILAATFTGSIMGILSVILVGKLFGADESLIISMAPKSVTTPIAMAVSFQNGGIPSLTAVFVIIVGILGATVGPMVLHKVGITKPIGKGLAMGTCAHGIGTAAAIQMGIIEGAISGLSIGLMGIFTALLTPSILSIFY